MIQEGNVKCMIVFFSQRNQEERDLQHNRGHSSGQHQHILQSHPSASDEQPPVSNRRIENFKS